jgi:RNA binding exosome subunit
MGEGQAPDLMNRTDCTMNREARPVAVEYAVFVHATEDFDKVIKAVENLMPPRLRERKKVEVEETYGHYENPIRIIRVSFRNPEYASQAFTWIWARLPDEDRACFMKDLDLHINDKSRLYMRLDKQEAFLGQARLSSGDDVIKVVFNFKGPREAVRNFLLSHDLRVV